MNLFAKSALIALSALALASCEINDKNVDPQANGSIPSDGKYFLSAVTVEAADASTGQTIETSPIQVIGQNYFWTLKALGNSQYEVTATGSTKFSTNNVVFLEWNCIASRDVIVFEITSDNTIRNPRMIETGCPQGFRTNDATQMSIETAGNGAFLFNYVAVGGGVRSVERYTFRK